MGPLFGATYAAAVLLLTEMATVASIPQQQVDNRIVHQPQGSLLVPIRQNTVNNVGQTQPSNQQQNFPVSQSAGLLPRDPQVQNHQNIPNNTRLPRPSQQDPFLQQGETSRPSNSQPNTGRPQSSSQGFESSVASGRRERDSSCGIFPSPGQCQAAFPRYYYNASTSQCECYLFGGCDEAIGSYRTLEECHLKCLPERKEEGSSCKHVYIENFHPPQPTVFPIGTQGPSSRPSGGNGQTQPSDVNRPIFNSPENARPQTDRPQRNRNPNRDLGVQGIPNSNFGSQNFNNGSPNVNLGSPNLNTGSSNFNNGRPDINVGMPNLNTGSPNFSNGSPNVNSGSPTFSNSSPNVNSGSLNVNTGSPNFNNGRPDMNVGTPNFDTRSPSFNNGPSDSNNGSPNFNNGQPNVNNEQRIPTSSNGRPVSNGPSRDSQILLPSPGIFIPFIPSSPGHSSNPVLLSDHVRFPDPYPLPGVIHFVQPPPIFSQNSGSRQTF